MRIEDLGKTSTPRCNDAGNDKERTCVSRKENNAGSTYVATKRVERGDHDSMDAIIVGYENTMARRYARNVGRLHRRRKRGNQTTKTNTRRAAKKWLNWRDKCMFKVNLRDHQKTNTCKEDRRHAAKLEIPEMVYEDCQMRLERATVKNHETIMLTLPIGGCL